jgi:hypothetical protein
VRKAFLCGIDNSTGESFEHRREWVDSRILELATIFVIDIFSYAFLLISSWKSLHVVVKVDTDKVKTGQRKTYWCSGTRALKGHY